MKFCQCILGRDGKCCQDKQPSGRTWVSDRITQPPWPGANTLVAGQMYTYGMPRRVRKSATVFGDRWIVTNHPAGVQSFPTWREAMDYASAPYMLMNSVSA